jgi:hypothetical protein
MRRIFSLFSSGSMLRTRVRPAAASASSLSSNVPQSRAPSSRRRRLGRLPVAGSRGCPRGCPRDCPRGSLRATLEAVLGVERASFAHAFRARIERTHWPRAHRGVRLLTRPPLMPRSVLLLAPALALPPYACTRRRRTRSAWTRPTRASARRPPPRRARRWRPSPTRSSTEAQSTERGSCRRRVRPWQASSAAAACSGAHSGCRVSPLPGRPRFVHPPSTRRPKR